MVLGFREPHPSRGERTGEAKGDSLPITALNHITGSQEFHVERTSGLAAVIHLQKAENLSIQRKGPEN